MDTFALMERFYEEKLDQQVSLFLPIQLIYSLKEDGIFLYNIQ